MGALWEHGGALVSNDGGTAILECDCCPCLADVRPCDVCVDGVAATAYSIVIAGIVQPGELPNGTFRAEHYTDCFYIFFDWNISGGANLVMQITAGQIDVYGTGGPHWTLPTSDDDCLNWVDLAIPLTDPSNGAGQDCTAATCRITAIVEGGHLAQPGVAQPCIFQ